MDFTLEELQALLAAAMIVVVEAANDEEAPEDLVGHLTGAIDKLLTKIEEEKK